MKYFKFSEDIDLEFIDSPHFYISYTYEYIKSDLVNLLNTLNKNMIIIWHDLKTYAISRCI